MTRKEFLQKVGIGASFALTTICFGSCTKDNFANAGFEPLSSDIVLNLNEPSVAALNTLGGYVIVDNKVVVARAMDGTFVAASRQCSHEPRNDVVFRNNEFYCTAHGARFSQTGGGLNSNGSNGLRTYQTQLNGNMLTLFA